MMTRRKLGDVTMQDLMPALNPAPLADVGVFTPIRVPFFDDVSSYGHAFLGAAMSRFPVLDPCVIFLFLVYQMMETEPLPNKVGDLAEFASGYLLAKSIEDMRGVMAV